MTLPPPDSLERLTHADLIGVVRDLIGEVTRMQAETEKLGGALAKLRVEHQAVKDELARLKHLPPRPPIKPSGMDKSTQAKGPEAWRREGRALIAPARQPTRQTEDWRNHCCEGRPACGLAQQGI
jgi:hypothetical protein